MRTTFARLSILAFALLIAGFLSGPDARAQDPGAPCGRDQYGRPYPCTRPDPSANLEAACLTTGRLENCIPYHRNACEIRGFPSACTFYNLGRNCYGGDPSMCNYYVALLRANTACNLNGDQSACAWLQQQRF